MKVLEAVSLEERFKAALSLLTKQIDGLQLLQKTKKRTPRSDKRVSRRSVSQHPFSFTTPNSRLTSAQVLPMRKSGVIPLEQFKVSDEEEDEEDTAVLEKKVYSVNMSEAALKVCLKELKR